MIVKELTCTRCKHKWYPSIRYHGKQPYVVNPKKCPNCHNDWREPKNKQ